MYPFALESSARFCEEYVVKFLDRTNEFVRQREMSVYFASKGRHDAARKVCALTKKVKDSDIVSVIYQ